MNAMRNIVKNLCKACILSFFMSVLRFFPCNVQADTIAETQQIKALADYSLVDTSGSKGSTGHHLGLSMIQSHKINDQSGNPSEKQSLVSTVYMHGTPFPVDFGVFIGHISALNNYTQYGGIAQVTVFESLGMPSLSLRYSRLEGANASKSIELQSDSLSWVCSYGVLPYVKPYFLLRSTSTTSRIQSSVLTDLEQSLSIWNENGDLIIQDSDEKTRRLTVGVKILLDHGTIGVSAETDTNALGDTNEQNVTRFSISKIIF